MAAVISGVTLSGDQHLMNVKGVEEGISLEALQKGGKRAFAQLVEIHSEAIYRVSFRMLNDAQDAEDILQETFIKAFRYLPTFEGRSQLSTWLYRIAINEALMLIRKRKPDTTSIDEEIETDQDGFIPRQIVDFCCLPEDTFDNRETQAAISRAVDRLSPANRATFILRDISGLSTKETADTLQISESAVKTRLLRARLELREALSGYFSDRMVTP